MEKEAKFVISRRVDGQYMFNLVAPNGEIIATSEGYKRLKGCINGIEAVKEYAKEAEVEKQ